MARTYLLRCADGSYYAGSTVDLERRLWEHDEGLGATYTRRRGRRPVALVWSHHFDSTQAAFDFEKQLQGWSRRKREALIRGDYEALPELARKDFTRRTCDLDSPPRSEDPDPTPVEQPAQGTVPTPVEQPAP